MLILSDAVALYQCLASLSRRKDANSQLPVDGGRLFVKSIKKEGC